MFVGVFARLCACVFVSLCDLCVWLVGVCVGRLVGCLLVGLIDLLLVFRCIVRLRSFIVFGVCLIGCLCV